VTVSPGRTGLICRWEDAAVRSVLTGLIVVCAACTQSSSTLRDSPVSTVSLQALPGESVEAAYQRVLNGCMDGVGEAPVQTFEDGARAYNQSKNLEVCEAKAQATALQIAPKVDLQAAYSTSVRFVQCLRDGGFDMGVTVSNDEFVNSGGAVTLASNWNRVAQLDGFADQMQRCDLATRPG
jgi:hypothetical protein